MNILNVYTRKICNAITNFSVKKSVIYDSGLFYNCYKPPEARQKRFRGRVVCLHVRDTYARSVGYIVLYASAAAYGRRVRRLIKA